MGQDGRTQAESRRARRVPLLDEVGELRRSAGEDLCVTGETAGAVVESMPSRPGRVRSVVEEDHEVGEHADRR